MTGPSTMEHHKELHGRIADLEAELAAARQHELELSEAWLADQTRAEAAEAALVQERLVCPWAERARKAEAELAGWRKSGMGDLILRAEKAEKESSEWRELYNRAEAEVERLKANLSESLEYIHGGPYEPQTFLSWREEKRAARKEG